MLSWFSFFQKHLCCPPFGLDDYCSLHFSRADATQQENMNCHKRAKWKESSTNMYQKMKKTHEEFQIIRYGLLFVYSDYETILQLSDSQLNMHYNLRYIFNAERMKTSSFCFHFPVIFFIVLVVPESLLIVMRSTSILKKEAMSLKRTFILYSCLYHQFELLKLDVA